MNSILKASSYDYYVGDSEEILLPFMTYVSTDIRLTKKFQAMVQADLKRKQYTKLAKYSGHRSRYQR